MESTAAMELRHLIYFEAVARHQHVSHAAAELAVAQPAVSKQIHDLERVRAPEHRLAGRAGVALAALADQPFLLSPRGYGMRDKTLEACQRAGFAPRVVLDGGEMDMVLRLAEVGLGIALMPRLALDA